MRTRADHDAERQKWVEEMGLLRRHTCPVKNNPFIAEFITYDWPKGDGRQYDRTVILTIFEDGSWQCALDDGKLRLADSKTALQRMALASEQEGE
jgi:hypothetical protein